MTEQTTTPAAPEDQPGPLTRLVEKFENHAAPEVHAAETAVGAIAADVKAALLDHTSTALTVAGELGALAKLVDPADAPLVAAVEALLPKVLSMAVNAGNLALKALKPAS
jgi:hypothetical protein